MEYGYFERRLKSKDNEIAQLREENATLREALEKIDRAGVCKWSRNIAKEALK